MLLSGYLIGRFKFRARVLAGWNLFVTAAAIVILVSVFQVHNHFYFLTIPSLFVFRKTHFSAHFLYCNRRNKNKTSLGHEWGLVT
jgi:hypothetical protein